MYQELSVTVHGMKLSHMEMRPGLAKIKLESSTIVKHVEFLKRSSEACNFLLAVFHRKGLLKLPQDDQQIIRLTFPPMARKLISGLK